MIFFFNREGEVATFAIHFMCFDHALCHPERLSTTDVWRILPELDHRIWCKVSQYAAICSQQ